MARTHNTHNTTEEIFQELSMGWQRQIAGSWRWGRKALCGLNYFQSATLQWAFGMDFQGLPHRTGKFQPLNKSKATWSKIRVLAVVLGRPSTLHGFDLSFFCYLCWDFRVAPRSVLKRSVGKGKYTSGQPSPNESLVLPSNGAGATPTLPSTETEAPFTLGKAPAGFVGQRVHIAGTNPSCPWLSGLRR